MLSFPQTISKNLILLPALLLFPLFVAPAAETEKGLRKEAAEVGRRLEEARESARSLGETERSLADELDRMDRELETTRREARATRETVARLDGGIAETEAAFARITNRLGEERRRAGARAAGLYKLHALGTFPLLAGAGSVGDFFERATALRRVMAQDEALLETLAARRAELDLLSGEIEIQRRERDAAARVHRKAAAALERRREERRNLLDRVRRERSLAVEAVEALREASVALDRRIRSLRKQARPRPPDGAFARHKGLLIMPVTGKIVSLFGPFENPEFGVRNFRSGIVIETEAGAPVRSVGSGEVIYAGWFKGYGHMIIIDHGDHYYTLYAHAGELFKEKGDAVGSGEIIAATGDGGALQGPGLHFEVRHHGKPIDPMEWLETG